MKCPSNARTSRGSWQQACEVEGYAANQYFFARLRRRMHTCFLQAREDKVVNRIFCPAIVLRHGGQGRSDRFIEGPVRPIDCTLFDPLFEDCDIGGRHGLGFALGRLRHQVMRVFGLNALDELALVGMTGDDGVGMAGTLTKGRFFQVQSQPRLAHLRIRPMTTKAITGQNRLHILIEIEMLRTVPDRPG